MNEQLGPGLLPWHFGGTGMTGGPGGGGRELWHRPQHGCSYAGLHLQNRILLSFHKDSFSLYQNICFQGGRGGLHKHMWKSLTRVLSCRVELSSLTCTQTWDLYPSLGDLFSQRIMGESGDEETQKPKSKSLCVEEESSCTWQSATKSEQAVMENGCVYRKSTSRPLAKAAALITGSQRIKFGSSSGACHAREVIKTELKWFHNSN